MEEESWRRKHKRGIMKGKILEEKSWRRNHGRGIMEQKSSDERACERNHGRGIVAEEWRRKDGKESIEKESWNYWGTSGSVWKTSGSREI